MYEVDVIVPVLDGGERFVACLQALQGQQGVRSRLVVVDNGSSDGSSEVAARFGAVVVKEARRSSYAARNAALAVATAPVVAFTDADCVPSPHWLRAGLDALERAGWDLCAGDVQQEPARTVAGRHDELTYLHQEVHVRNMGFGATANLFVRRSVFDVVGLFDPGLQSGGDLDFGRRARRAGLVIGYVPEAVVRHQPREGLASVLVKAWRLGAGQAQVARRDPWLWRWGLSPRRLLPGLDLVRRSWRQPSVVLVEVLVKWVGWVARMTTTVAFGIRRPKVSQHRRAPVMMVSAWWPTASQPHERPFIVDHTRALQRAVGDVQCWAVVPGFRGRRAGTQPFAIAGLDLVTRAPRVPWRLSVGRLGFVSLFLAGWLRGRWLRVPPRAVVLQGFDYAGPYAMGLARAARRPLVYVEHWSAVALQELPMRQLATLRRVIAGSDAVLAVSPYLAAALERVGSLPAGSVGVVGNVVDPSVFAATPPPRRGGTTIAQVADFRPVKGHDLLVDALLLVGQEELEALDVRFVLVGDGPERREIERRLASVPAAADRVRFTGKLARDEVAKVMVDADWTLLTSRSETFSCVSVESLAVGRPVIAPRVGALDALISDHDGILYDRSVAGLVGALRQAAKPGWADGWRERSEAAVARFGPESVTTVYQELFRSIDTGKR